LTYSNFLNIKAKGSGELPHIIKMKSSPSRNNGTQATVFKNTVTLYHEVAIVCVDSRAVFCPVDHLQDAKNEQ